MTGTENGKSKSKLLIKGGTVVNDDMIQQLDIYIDDGVIQSVSQSCSASEDAVVIDAHGMFIIPAGVDYMTNLECISKGAKSSEDFQSGSMAAIAGGTTTIVNCVMSQENESLIDAIKKFKEKACSKSCCDFAFHIEISKFDETISQQMKEVVDKYGVSSFYTSTSNDKMDDDALFDLMQRCRELGAILILHAENGKIVKKLESEILKKGVTGPEGYLMARPEELEESAIVRALLLADQANCPIVFDKVHSRSACKRIAEARQKGQIVFAQTSVAGIGARGDGYFDKDWRKAAGYVVSPPLRIDDKTGAFLIDSLSSGDLQNLASNHFVFKGDAKALGKDDFRKIPEGVNGIEDRLSILWELGVNSGQLDICKLVGVTSTNAAKMLGVYPRKGRLAVGSDADIVIVNVAAKQTLSAASHHENVDFNVFDGLECQLAINSVIYNGELVLSNNELNTKPGAGNFITACNNNQFVYGRLKFQSKSREPVKIQRDAYTGEVVDLHKEEANIRSNPITCGYEYKEEPEPELPPGTRKPQKTSVKTHQPPGGASSGFSFW